MFSLVLPLTCVFGSEPSIEQCEPGVVACLVRSVPLHVTPVELLIRVAHWFTWRVGVRVCVSFLFLLALVDKSKSLVCARHFSWLFCFLEEAQQ